MKIERPPKPFRPVIITLETYEELVTFYNKFCYNPRKHPISIHGHITNEELKKCSSKIWRKISENIETEEIIYQKTE